MIAALLRIAAVLVAGVVVGLLAGLVLVVLAGLPDWPKVAAAFLLVAAGLVIAAKLDDL